MPAIQKTKEKEVRDSPWIEHGTSRMLALIFGRVNSGWTLSENHTTRPRVLCTYTQPGAAQ